MIGLISAYLCAAAIEISSLLNMHVCIYTDFDYKFRVNEENFCKSMPEEFRGISRDFIIYGEKYDVNPVVLSALAAAESGWGRSYLADKYNNIFGWKNNDGIYAKFSSKEECIEYVARSIRTMYLNESGIYYSGGTLISDVSKNYNNNQEWVFLVEEIARNISLKIS